MPAKIRLDRLLFERGLAPSRERAQALILAGKVLVREQKIEKPGAAVDPSLPIRLLAKDLKYVSRGGLKLEHALHHWKIDVRGHACLDIGASTGGFTDCMLQHGAASVIAVDTGYGQIAARLRNDPRVHLLERTNARYLTAEQLATARGLFNRAAQTESSETKNEKPKTKNSGISFAAIDVSFISVTLVLPAVLRAAAPPEMVILIKPQFELGKRRVGKGGGIVRSHAARAEAVEKVRGFVRSEGGTGIEVTESPITGAEGNHEFLLRAFWREASQP